MRHDQYQLTNEIHKRFTKYGLEIPKASFYEAFDEIFDQAGDPLIYGTGSLEAFKQIFPLPGSKPIGDPAAYRSHLRCLLAPIFAEFNWEFSHANDIIGNWKDNQGNIFYRLLPIIFNLTEKWLLSVQPLVEADPKMERHSLLETMKGADDSSRCDWIELRRKSLRAQMSVSERRLQRLREEIDEDWRRHELKYSPEAKARHRKEEEERRRREEERQEEEGKQRAEKAAQREQEKIREENKRNEDLMKGAIDNLLTEKKAGTR